MMTNNAELAQQDRGVNAYIVGRWRKVTTGSSNVLGADWVEL